jgi:hypothetical protein
MPNYHPDLPSIESAHTDYDQVRSDHVPILAEVPLRVDLDGAASSLDAAETPSVKLVSWNVLENDSGNGYAALGEKDYGETDAQRKDRHARIAANIRLFAEEHAPEFIVLQEINSTSQLPLLPEVLRELGDDYSCLEFDKQAVDCYGCITLYNNKKVTPEVRADDIRGFEDTQLGGNVGLFQLIEHNNQIIKVSNVHVAFNKHPELHEKRIKAALECEDDIGVSVVLGDFNCSVAPLDTDARNITTSVAPSFFEGSHVQGAYAIDGCFYRHASVGADAGAETQRDCHQATINHLNPENGQVYLPGCSELAALDFSEETQVSDEYVARQQKEASELRMVMAVDASYSDRKLINNEFTIFDYQDKLRELYDNDTLIVRPARDLSNRSGIGITITRALYDWLKDFEDVGIVAGFQLKQFDNPSTCLACYTVCVEERDVLALTSIIENIEVISRAPALLALITQNASLQKSSVGATLKQKFDTLLQTLLDQSQDDVDAIESIAEHFSEVARSLLDGSRPSVDEIESSAKALDKKLYGKRPLSKPLKAAICGVIGALVGFAVGLVIGGLITSWGGGFGALPGAILGGLKGFSVGTAVGIGATALGGTVSAGGGFFSAKSNNKQYLDEKAAKESALSAPLKDSFENCFSELKVLQSS